MIAIFQKKSHAPRFGSWNRAVIPKVGVVTSQERQSCSIASSASFMGASTAAIAVVVFRGGMMVLGGNRWHTGSNNTSENQICKK